MRPKTYGKFLLTAASVTIPRGKEWWPVVTSVVDAAFEIWGAVTVTVFRLLILVTFPVSVPVLALWMMQESRKADAYRAQYEKEHADSMFSIVQKGGQHGADT